MKKAAKDGLDAPKKHNCNMLVLNNIKNNAKRPLSYRDLRIPYAVISMDKLCPCFFQEKPRVGANMLAMTMVDSVLYIKLGCGQQPALGLLITTTS